MKLEDKNGFTLVELLIVIAIIAILSIIIVPSVLKINDNINDELYTQKVDNIETAAELYASNNPDIFNGATEVKIKVKDLIKGNYIEIDTNKGDNCADDDGCVVNPKDKTSMNEKEIIITKRAVGVEAKYSGDIKETDSTDATLVSKVCDGFGRNYDGKYGTGDNDYCFCKDGKLVKAKKNSDGEYSAVEPKTEVEACILVSNVASGNVDNWLKYGSSEANWRVVGLYKIGETISAKMITSSVIQ